MDDYQKSGPKTSKAASREREREMQSQMRDLLAIDDENTFVSILKCRVRPNSKRSAIRRDYADLE